MATPTINTDDMDWAGYARALRSAVHHEHLEPVLRVRFTPEHGALLCLGDEDDGYPIDGTERMTESDRSGVLAAIKAGLRPHGVALQRPGKAVVDGYGDTYVRARLDVQAADDPDEPGTAIRDLYLESTQ